MLLLLIFIYSTILLDNKEKMHKYIAYLRVSTEKQDLDSQRLSIMDYAHVKNIKIEKFIQAQASSRLSDIRRKIDVLYENLEAGDTLIVSELSRLGRSLGQIIQIIDRLIKKEINFVALKENIVLNGKHDMQSKVMVTMFGLFAEIERDLISERTKQALAAARAKGKLLGRPKGSIGKSKLDGKEEEIRLFLSKGASRTSVAKIMDISRTALYSFVDSRKLATK